MGSSQSTLSTTRLEQFTEQDIKHFVHQLGTKYERYGDAILENALDGELLSSLESEDEFKETLECLEITNFLHQKKLLMEWKKAKERAAATPPSPTSKPSRNVSSFTTRTSITDASSLTMDTSLTVRRLSLEPEPEEEKIPEESSSTAEDEDDFVEKINNTYYPDPVPMVVTTEQLDAVKSFYLPRGAPVDCPELEPFHQVASQAFDTVKGSVYSGVNLLDQDGGIGVNGLSTILQGDTNGMQRARLHFDSPGGYEICRPFVLGQTMDFRIEDVPLEVCQGGFRAGNSTYYGHIIRFRSIRIGTICCIVENSRNTKNPTQIQALLKFLAQETERQLERRHALLHRNFNLKQDIQDLKRQVTTRDDDRIVAPPFGPVRAVTASQVANRQTLFPYPEETSSETGNPTLPEFQRRSSHLSYWAQARQAPPTERPHIKPDYYKPLLRFPIDQTPIGKKDMERVALVKSMSLFELDPLCKEAQNIKSIVDMTATLLQGDFVGVYLLDQSHANIFFPTHSTGNLQVFEAQQEVVKHHPTTGEPFWTRIDRCLAFCNYTVMSPTPEHQAFVVHNVAADQSLAGWKTFADVGFYSGAPIVIRGTIVGALCCLNQAPRPSFGRAQEVQQEQLASFIAQQYESWSLGHEMKRLEEERSRLVQCVEENKSAGVVPPEDYAALVLTDVQGADALWGANSRAMKDAVALHNDIVRAKIADHGGYEVQSNQEGAEFYVAFADVVDAVRFCLAAQEELHAAPWGQDLLSLPEASEDSTGGFRGLRVRMAVHCGDVETTTDPSSRCTLFTGETVHIAESLRHMGYGGQILLTCDVWNVAAQFVESLGSPQVVDQGSHVVRTESTQLHDGITIKNVLQLVPASLAFDYKQSRLQTSGGRTSGRVFPPVKTAKAVGRSFSDAPCGEGNTVSIVTVNTAKVEASVDEPSLVLAALAKRISSCIAEHDGYQCNDFTFAFGKVAAAVRFGLAVQELLEKENVCDVCLVDKVQIGVHEGSFESMWPHAVTGKAEYFGKVVNCSSFVAADASPGCVYLGKEADELDGIFMQPISNGFMLDFMGRKAFEGIQEEFSLYKCHACESWYDKVLDNRRTWRGY